MYGMEDQGEAGGSREGEGGTKMTMEQKIVMVEFMEDHPDFSKNKLLGNDGKQNRKTMWEIVCTQLNGVSGPKKTSQKWQRVWIDLKNKVKKKASEIKQSRNRTGGGPPLKVVLTDLEQKILNIIGETAVYGLQSSQDAPLDSEDVNSHSAQPKIIQPNLPNLNNQQPSTSQMTKPKSHYELEHGILSSTSSPSGTEGLEDHTYYSMPIGSKKRKLSERSSSPSSISESAMSLDDGLTPRRRRVGEPMTVAAQTERFAEIGETLNKRMECIESKLDAIIKEKQETNSILRSLVAAIYDIKK